MGRAALALLALLVLLGLGVTPVLAAADKAAPTVSITPPEPGVTFAAEQVEVTAVYSAASGAAITRVELVVDGMVVASSDRDPAEESGVLSLVWQASGYLDGKHAVVVRVTDTKGRTAKATIPALLQRGPLEARPPLAITSPGSRTTVSGPVSIRIEAESTVRYVIFLVDNVFKAMSNRRPFSFTWDTTNYLNGLHRLQARGYLDDGTDVLSAAFDVRVDNPSGATTLKTPEPLPAAAIPTPAPVPKTAAPPARAAESMLPPARHVASPTPYSAAEEVSGAEIGAPGTAPYYDASREVVTRPTTVVAERTPAGAELKVATIAEATELTSAPTAAGASVSAPPVPAPTNVAGGETEVVSAATAESAAVTTAPKVAPVQVAALPTPASVPERTEASHSPSPVGAASAAQPAAVTTSAEAITANPLAIAKTSAAAVPTPAPVVATAAAPTKAALVAQSALQTVPAPIPVATVAQTVPAAPVKVALLPAPAAPARPAPVAAEPKTATQVILNGESLNSDQPVVVAADDNGNRVHLLPLRAVVEQLNGTVLWQHEAKRAIADARGNRIVVTIQHIAAQVNGRTVEMEVRPVIASGRTLVQARFLADALDLSLDLDGEVLRLAVN